MGQLGAFLGTFHESDLCVASRVNEVVCLFAALHISTESTKAFDESSSSSFEAGQALTGFSTRTCCYSIYGMLPMSFCLSLSALTSPPDDSLLTVY